MIPWRSLELRLTAWYALMLFLGYLALSAILWLAVRSAVRGAADGLLQERIELVRERIAADAEDALEEGEGYGELEEDLIEHLLGAPEGHLSRVRDESDRELFALGDGEQVIPWHEGGGLETVEVDGRPYRVLWGRVAVLERSYEVLLASSLQSLVEVRDRLTAAFVVATPLALVLCSGGGFWIARGALSPLDKIVETAADITVSNLSRRIDAPRTGDSLERLAVTFNEMLSRLETSVGRIEQFSADASHELRTPLSVIRTTAELALRHGRSEEDYRADLKEIQVQAERLTELIEVLLTLSRRSVESRSVPMADVDLVSLSRSVSREFQEDARAKGLELRLDAPERPVKLVGNEPSLRRLLASLLENALAHTSSGSVTVSVDELGLTVTDTGEGIPEDALGRVFDRFYRVDASRSRAGGRLGLGLSIAQRIAELHDAEISVQSRMGEGSCFTVRFRR